MTDDGAIDIATSDDMLARFRLSNWHVQEVDGHDDGAVSAALLLAKRDPRPSMIACTTVIGRGLPKVEGTRAAHSARITKEIAAAAREYLVWPHPPFEVPAPILQAWRDAGRRSLPAYEAWQARVQALSPEKRRLLDRLREGRLRTAGSARSWPSATAPFRSRVRNTGSSSRATSSTS
jgi:transketolase